MWLLFVGSAVRCVSFLPQVVPATEDEVGFCVKGGAHLPQTAVTAGAFETVFMPVFVQGLEQVAVFNLAIAASTPLLFPFGLDREHRHTWSDKETNSHAWFTAQEHEWLFMLNFFFFDKQDCFLLHLCPVLLAATEHCLPASYALKKTFFHVDRHTGHIGLHNPDLLVPALSYTSFMMTSSCSQRKAPCRVHHCEKTPCLFYLLRYLQQAVYLSYLPFHQSPFHSTVRSCKSSSWALFGID